MSRLKAPVETRPTPSDIGNEMARLFARIRTGPPTPTTPSNIISAHQTVEGYRRQIDTFGRHITEVLAYPWLDNDDLDFAKLKGSERMAGYTEMMSRCSITAARLQEEFEEHQRGVLDMYEQALIEDHQFFTANEEVIVELAITEAHLAGVSLDLEQPLVIG